MKPRASSDDAQAFYHSIFQYSAISLWLQDIADLRRLIAHWNMDGVGDLRAFLKRNPAELRRAVHAVEVIDVNDATLELYEVGDKSALIGPLDRTLDLDDPVIRDSLAEDITAVAEGLRHRTTVSAAVTPSGRRLDIELRVYIPPETSPFPYMLVNVIDITDRERNRKALDRERALLRALMDNIPDRIYFKDRDSRFTLVNLSQARSLGVNGPDEVIGKTDFEFFTQEHARRARADEMDIMRSGAPMIDKEERETHPDGSEPWLLTTKMALRDETGRISGTFGVSRDITVQKTLREQRLRAQRLEGLGQLASGIAHQFNNINASVIGFLRLAIDESATHEKSREYVRQALDGVQRTVAITQRLEILANARGTRSTAVVLEETIERLLPSFEERARNEGITINLELAGKTVARAARATVEFVFSSTMSNAFHALLGRPARRVTIRTANHSGIRTLEVEDTGCGIVEDDIPKIFTPFYTTKGEWAGSGSPQSQARGAGLSLSVCRSLVTADGGHIEIDSTYGVGTKIFVSFPAAQ